MSTSGRAAKLVLWLIGLAAIAVPASALAQGTPDRTLFGPKQYVRTTGATDVYTDSFSVPVSVGAPFSLRIVNGAASGQKRITFGWIKVNGVQVVGPADFGVNVATIERPLNLLPNDTLEVRLASAPGGFLTLSILGTRIPPVPTSLAPNPLTVTAGASGTLSAALSPAPDQAGALSVLSANAGVASVPASVPFAVGQSTVGISVTGVAAGNTSVTASANGGSASAAVTITPAPPTVTGLSPTALLLTQGSNGTLTVSISAAQATNTEVAVSSSHTGIASVPGTVTVPPGQVTAPVSVGALSLGDAQITVSLNGSSASSQVTVTPAPPTPVSLVPALSSVALGGGTTLTLTLSSAQAADTVVPLTVSPPAIVTVPAQVTVPAGGLTGTVTVATLAYGQAGITASLNGTSASAAINVVPPPAVVTALEPPQLAMTLGATSLFTVRINAAQTTNTEIALLSSDPAVLQVPAAVSVAQGATAASFGATALATGDVLITASANNISKSTGVHVAAQAPAIISLLLSPLPLQQGATGTLTVTLNAAQDAATAVAIANTAPAVVEVPASVTIPAGAISAQVPAYALSPGTAQITASVNGSSVAASVAVAAAAPAVATLAPGTLSLPKGTPALLRVTVSRAPNATTAVALVSTNPSVASVPPQVNVPAGGLFAEFPVTANSEGQATITASLNGVSASSMVTIAPAELVALTLSPQKPTNYVGEAVPFTATGTMTDGTSEDFTTRPTWSSSNTSVATIASTGVASALSQGPTTVTASFTFTAVQSGQPVTISSSTDLTVKTPTALVLAAPVTSLRVGESVTVSVGTSDAPPFGGLLVTLSGGGSGAGTYPPAVTIPEYQTSAAFQFTATAAGNYTISAR